jgi:hypothetical protein
MASADPAIYGGEFADERLGAFIAAWGLPREDMPWSIWEQVDTIEMRKEPSVLQLVERGRVFGEAGDLALRRDRGRFLWHFVGRRDVTGPNGFDVEDFWNVNGPVELISRQSTALLWGRQVATGVWREDRVGRATLAYPALDAERVRVSYRTYSSGGQVLAIWWQGLEADK